MAETKKKAAATEATEETAAKKAAPKKPVAKKATTAKKPAAKKAAPKAEEAAPAVAEEKPAKKPAAKKAPAKKPAAKKAAPKAEEKPAKPAKVKPVVTSATSIAKNIRVTPRKCRLVADVVRGKDVDEALAILANLNKAASEPVSKVIKAAAADATHNFNLNGEKLYVAEIQVGDGMKMKRFMPRGKGSSSGLVKRCAHIRVTVKERK
ncbi:MAG: 50S ribosomal protein L22 [Bacilli bacterium]|nr:50S ribosomal protein L22 [Bacilli bacterium]